MQILKDFLKNTGTLLNCSTKEKLNEYNKTLFKLFQGNYE